MFMLTNFFYLLLNCYFVYTAEKDKKCLDGVCTLISQCPIALENLKNGIFPKICRFEDEKSEPTICCHNLQEQTSTEILRLPEHVSEHSDTIIFPEEKPELSIFKKKCKEYALQTCGGTLTAVSNDKMEEDTKIFPHTALIGYGEYSNIFWKCSGSLISESYVLTAARCEYLPNYGYAQWIQLGTKTSKYLNFEILQRIIHPDYFHPSLKNDIALFKLKEKVQFDVYIHPICLFEEHTFKHDHLSSVGFGREKCINSECNFQISNELQTDVILAADAQIGDFQDCENLYRNYEELSNGMDHKSTICASLTQPHLGECQGIAGDSFIREIKTGCPSFYELVGVLSTVNHSANGVGCYFLNTTMIYTKVSYFLPWIEKIVWNHT